MPCAEKQLVGFASDGFVHRRGISVNRSDFGLFPDLGDSRD
jgi:hypothetical protein